MTLSRSAETSVYSSGVPGLAVSGAHASTDGGTTPGGQRSHAYEGALRLEPAHSPGEASRVEFTCVAPVNDGLVNTIGADCVTGPRDGEVALGVALAALCPVTTTSK